DDWDPVVLGVTHDDAWHTGALSFPWVAEDTTGVKRAYAWVDGSLAWSANYEGDCSYTRPTPCVRRRYEPARIDAPSSDGVHSMRLGVDDAAGRHDYSETFYFKTDNTAPDRPSAVS